jgi:uncharacterized membrane protein
MKLERDQISYPLIGWLLLLVTGALGRLHALESLSPPDLAFFHQASWAAIHGYGFEQTALEFDRGTLLGSVHISLVRLLWLPVHIVAPRVEGLIALQALAVGLSGLAALRLCRSDDGIPGPWSRGALLLCPLFPLLATADLRPLVFLLPASLWVIVGLREGRWFLVLGSGLIALSAREEAPYILGALVPWALWSRRSGQNFRSVWILAGLTLLGFICVELLWSGSGNIRTSIDPGATLASVMDGERKVFRWEQEWKFMLLLILGGLPALRAPLLLAPGILAWLYLAVFSDFEPMAPHHGGLHYLSVVAPFFIGAFALGMSRLEASGWMSRGRAHIFWGLALLTSAPHWIQVGDWTRSLIEQPQTGPRAMVRELRSQEGGVLAASRVAPLLSERRLLRIQGHFAVTPERSEEVANEIDWALLPLAAPAGEAGITEWAAWSRALPAAGLEPLRQEEGWVLWGHPP